ncbi:MAG: 2-C-methyl-D-erythritol 2,4-cyclodiphosphate synthase [Bacteroidetes bacterium 4572_77]|nr:MAG: 2-C-methyl-D-erythritol 2,4-cyclodiphosphate synthase [Bacteroidetes bacterium 4572_77]
MRIGTGYDVHELVPNRKLILGGVEIAYHLGCKGHSDADVLMHAIIDAILGALAMGDIGQHFPDTLDKYKNISSLVLLKDVYEKVLDKAYVVGNIDSTIVMQNPKLQLYIPEMRKKIAQYLNVHINQISVKATTTERMGFQGREQGVSAQAVCLLLKI